MVRIAWRFLLWMFPFIIWVLVFALRIMWRAARGAFSLALAGVGGLVAGIPQGTQSLADDWIERIVTWGVPPLTIERFVPVMRVWGFILIFMGWVVIGLVIGIIVVWVN